MCNARALWLLLGCAGLGLAGCEAPPEPDFQFADREFAAYQALHPVLIRDCGFHTCHGSEERMFRVYGAGRARLDDDSRAYEEITGPEVVLSFDLALSMIDSAHPERSPLLRKPLAIEAGGAPHDGVDDFGRDVYRTVDDDGYRALERFVLEMSDAEAAATND